MSAEKCQGQISTLVDDKDSFAQRYSIVLEELRLEAIKQRENRGLIYPDNANHDPDRDRDREVAHTILRLSDNNNMDTYSMTMGNQQGDSHHGLNNIGPFVRGQPHLTTGYGLFDNFQTMPSNGNGGFHQNFSTSPTSLIDGTGWGDLDSFVSIAHSSFPLFIFHS
jgi:hypothetical protein